MGCLVRSTNGAGCAKSVMVLTTTRMYGFEWHTVDLHLAVGDNGLDLSLLLEILQALAGQ